MQKWKVVCWQWSVRSWFPYFLAFWEEFTILLDHNFCHFVSTFRRLDTKSYSMPSGICIPFRSYPLTPGMTIERGFVWLQAMPLE